MPGKEESAVTDSPTIGVRSTDEFAQGASEWPEGLSRRDFLRLASATLALAGFSSCTKQPLEKIVPYVEQPEIVIPGKDRKSVV